jgi:hypothetical protein
VARLARVVAVDVPHHATQPGNARRFILDCDADWLSQLFEKSLDLRDAKEYGNAGALCALSHSRHGILIMPFPADRVIENSMHQIANLGPASVC